MVQRNETRIPVLDRSTVCINWYNLWSSFGFTEYQWLSRVGKVEEYARKLLDDKLLTYREQLIKRRQLIKQLFDDYEDLLQRTGLSSTIDMLLFEKLKLKEQESYLDRKISDLLIEEEKLIHQRNELEKREKYLSTLLNENSIQLSERLIDYSMSLTQINKHLEDHITILNQIKDKRLVTLATYYIKLKEYSQRLDWSPSSSISPVQCLLFEQYDHCLTNDCLNEIESTIGQLENEIENQINHFDVLHKQLTHLHQRLNKDPCFKYKIDRDNINASIIRQIEQDLRYCREERMKNGKEYCHLIRQSIIDLLEKSYLSDNERIFINKLDYETLSFDLLDAYDNEYERIFQLYERRRPVIDAYNKWLSCWNEFVTFTKTSTDPGRFHVRGYNADVEARQRKRFHRDLPIVEQEFLNILSNYNEQEFLINNKPIRQIFSEAHQQMPIVNIRSNTPKRTPIQSRNYGSTARTPKATPCRIANKEPFVVGTAIKHSMKCAIKTPASVSRKLLLNKASSRTQIQSNRIKSHPDFVETPPSHQIPIHPPVCNSDQSLDFSLLHTIKNVYGQVMTSTPNSSFLYTDMQNGRTARNAINERKIKRRSKRTPVTMNMIESMNDETILCL